MEEERENLFDLNSTEFAHYISDIYIKLGETDERFIKLKEEKEDIINKNRKLILLLEGEKIDGLTSEECLELSKLYSIIKDMDCIHEKAIFFAGNKEAYIYFKNMNILK